MDEAMYFDIVLYRQYSPDGYLFYLLEISSLQVLREFPIDTPLTVKNIFSDSEKAISQKTDAILAASTVKEFLDITIPLAEGGRLEITDLTILIDNHIELTSHDDGEVHLLSNKPSLLNGLIKKILVRQRFCADVLTSIVAHPNQYLKLERPNRILSKHDTFEEAIKSKQSN